MSGERILLEPTHQYAVAAFLCLVATRIDASAKLAHPIPPSDHLHLINKREPGESWRIWISEYPEGGANDYWYNQFPMAMKAFPRSTLETLSPQQLSARAEDSNTQVTTLVVGRLFAHMFSTAVWTEFGGYLDAPIAQIWPVNGLIIDTHWLPAISEDEVHWLHEAIGRDRNPPDFRKQD